jgi:PiT family inorganic phosphate transporter
MNSDLIVVLVVALALVFAFTNGFHDAFDLISTAVSTGAAPPGAAVAAVALLNFAGAFVSLAVAITIATEVIDAGAIEPGVVFCALLGAVAWNLATTRLGIPSSSSHALIGGLIGAALAAGGTGALIGDGLLDQVLVPALLAPLAAFLLAGLAIVLSYRAFGRRRPGAVTRGFRRAQLLSGALLALGHGANDGQKTIGVIALALIAEGSLDSGADPPFWAIAASAAAIGLGAYGGGLRLLRGAGRRVIEMDAAQAFSAQGAGAAAILTATFLGFPISTTQAINGGVIGAGATKRLSAARWGIAGNIVLAWVLTVPAAAAVGAAAWGIAAIFGA